MIVEILELALLERSKQLRHHIEAPFFRFAGALPFVRRLDGVVDGVAHQMDQGREDPLGHRLVELGAAGVDLEVHALAGGAGEATHEKRDALEHLGHADHADAQDRRAEGPQLTGVVVKDETKLRSARPRRVPRPAAATRSCRSKR